MYIFRTTPFPVTVALCLPRGDKLSVLWSEETRESVSGAVVPTVPPVAEIKLRALVLQSVHASLSVDQQLEKDINLKVICVLTSMKNENHITL